MEKDIIKILKQNRLYDKYNEENNKNILDDNNKIDEFFKTYKYNGSRKQKLPDNITRKDGSIVLDEIPFITSNKTDFASDNKWIILNNGTKLYLKDKRTKIENILELLIMYFLKEINVNHAKYDIATFKNKEFLISQSFLENNEGINFVFMNQKIPEITKGYNKTKKYNNEILFLKTCLIDRIIGNTDRFPCNYGLIIGGKVNKKDKKPRNCPLFDNVDKNNIFIREDYGYYRFPYISNRENSSCDKIINYILKNEMILNWLINNFDNANIYNCANKLLKEKNIYTDKDTYYKAESFFGESEKIINEELKNLGKSKRIKLT